MRLPTAGSPVADATPKSPPTTTAATMFSGSPKSNILPTRAEAVVNFRILPGETAESVRDRVIDIIRYDDAPRDALMREHDISQLPVQEGDEIVGYCHIGMYATMMILGARSIGHDVVLYDSQPSPGGWLRDGIPRYRLSPDALEADVEDIVALGVEQLGLFQDGGERFRVTRSAQGHNDVIQGT